MALFHAGNWLLLVPCVLFHGSVFTFLGYAGIGHELNHGTVFTNAKVNQALLHMVSFLTWGNPVYYRQSHLCHHKYTLQTGTDFDVTPTPYPLLEQWYKYAFFDVQACRRALTIFFQNAKGQVKGPFGEKTFPKGSILRAQLVRTARLYLLGHIVFAGVFIAMDQPMLLLLISLADFIATLPNRLLAKLQHSKMQKNCSDFRNNSRTILLPKWLAFFYWNMNYHIEHHMYPNVPYLNLPTLREIIVHDLPDTDPGFWNNLEYVKMQKPGNTHKPDL